jgi:hypothetical protein
MLFFFDQEEQGEALLFCPSPKKEGNSPNTSNSPPNDQGIHVLGRATQDIAQFENYDSEKKEVFRVKMTMELRPVHFEDKC